MGGKISYFNQSVALDRLRGQGGDLAFRGDLPSCLLTLSYRLSPMKIFKIKNSCRSPAAAPTAYGGTGNMYFTLMQFHSFLLGITWAYAGLQLRGSSSAAGYHSRYKRANIADPLVPISLLHKRANIVMIKSP